MEILFISEDVAKMLNGKTYGENLYFNPVQDEEGRWFISQEEVNGFFAKNPIPEPVEVDEIAAWRVRAALRNNGIKIPVLLDNIRTIVSDREAIIVEEALNGSTIDKFHPLTQLACNVAGININTLWDEAKLI